MSALKWQGWLVGLLVLAGLLVFAPLGLYVWASGEPAPQAPATAAGSVRVTGCRIDPASRRVVAGVEATGQGSYVVTVEFRDPTVASLDTDGLDLPAEDLDFLLTVDKEIWRDEAALVPEHLNT
ncbi:hypothetical protein HET69_33380, partial [Streptomyces sp. CJ_13]|uniref:hypothetical protein n=1 Tax=Streptomyces sp. CJ_13 TaxID=2724943 RepID=UPI001BDDA5C1